MEISVYVLHGTWCSQDVDGAEVLGISLDIGPLLRRLDRIADTKAGDFVEMRGQIQENRGERYYEAVDGGWRHVAFHITEHSLDVPEREAERRRQGAAVGGGTGDTGSI